MPAVSQLRHCSALCYKPEVGQRQPWWLSRPCVPMSFWDIGKKQLAQPNVIFIFYPWKLALLWITIVFQNYKAVFTTFGWEVKRYPNEIRSLQSTKMYFSVQRDICYLAHQKGNNPKHRNIQVVPAPTIKATCRWKTSWTLWEDLLYTDTGIFPILPLVRNQFLNKISSPESEQWQKIAPKLVRLARA